MTTEVLVGSVVGLTCTSPFIEITTDPDFGSRCCHRLGVVHGELRVTNPVQGPLHGISPIQPTFLNVGHRHGPS